LRCYDRGAVVQRRIQRFDVVEELGSGGMGAVYRAHDPQLDRDVAIKVLRSSRADARAELSTVHTLNLRDNVNGERAGLLHEARIMARLSHPNIVPIYEVGLDASDVFVVMEHVDGCDLRRWLQEPHTTQEIIAVFAHAAQGLAAAHARGIVHRDFKPDNVLIGGDGRARVADFGLSRVAVEPARLVRTGEQAGTPKYMAPELWGGEPATTGSDVYAFAIAVVEAFGGDERGAQEDIDRVLRGRGVGKPVRDLIAAALDARVAARPDMARIAAVLAPGGHSRRVAVAGIAMAAVALIGLVAAFTQQNGEDGPSCDAVVVRWGIADREALRLSFAATRSADDRDHVRALLAAIDRRAGDIAQTRAATCAAGQREKLTKAQLALRVACVERRALELGAVIDTQLVDRSHTDAVEQTLNRVPAPASCEKLVAGPTLTDTRVADLYQRYLRWSAVDAPPEALAELARVEQDAVALGDLELAARAAVNLAIRTRSADQVAKSDEILQRAYGRAIEARSFDTAASALCERAALAYLGGDLDGAKSLIGLALEVASKETIQPRTLMRVHSTKGRMHVLRGEYRDAAAALREGLQVSERHGQRNIDVAILIRHALTDALVLSAEQPDEAIRVAHQTLELTRQHFGEQHANHVLALDLVGKAYIMAHQTAPAVDYRRQVLAAALRLHGPEHSSVIDARTQLAVSLIADGQAEEGHRMLAEIRESVERNPVSRRTYPFVLTKLAEATYALGRYEEGMRLYEQAIELMTSEQGADHPGTLAHRYVYIGHALDLGWLDTAERGIALLDEAYRRTHRPRDTRPAELHGVLAAELAVLRGRAADGERVARTALAELDELGASDDDRQVVQYMLGRSLVARRKHAEAAPILEASRATAARRRLRRDYIALIDLELAKIDLAQGRRETGIERARDVSDVLDSFLDQPRGRAEVASFLAASKRQSSSLP
jgi:eukaryotic-like serine/threonine-protein kinase